MRKKFIEQLTCPGCKSTSLELTVENENEKEIREGKIICASCNQEFEINRGVLNFISRNSELVALMQKNWKEFDLHEEAIPFTVDEAVQFKDELFSLPEGNNSIHFQKNTLLKSITHEKDSFNKGMSMITNSNDDTLLDLGADICWSTYRFAMKGCSCVALDINHHLPISDVYIYGDDVYFERMMGDMCDLPFRKETFNWVVSVASIHHIENINPVFKEIARVLKTGGRAILIAEPIRRLLETKHFGTEQSIKFDLRDHWFSAIKYYLTARRYGLKMKFYYNINLLVWFIDGEPGWKRRIKKFIIEHSHEPYIALLFLSKHQFDDTIMVAKK